MRTRSPFRRPCLDCGRLGQPGKSRCPEHESGKEKERKAARGATPVANKLRRELRSVYEWPCNECQLIYPPTYLQIDHIVPLVDRGTDTLGNCQVLCLDCHERKTIKEAKQRAHTH